MMETTVIRTVEAVIDEHGEVHLPEGVELPAARRALVTILDEESPVEGVPETALLSDAALAQDWDRPEENAAWSYLNRAL
jgi:hypothetical protein